MSIKKGRESFKYCFC